MSDEETDYPHKALTGKIIGFALEVHRELRPGLDEIFYEKSLVIELDRAGMFYDQQTAREVYYKGHFLGHRIPDLVVENTVVVDCKVLREISEAQIAQMLCYLRLTGCPVGLILNFNNAKLELRRVIRPTHWD